MLSRLREHLGTAGLVVAIAALVAALGGGAIAATGGSGNGSEATASAKAKKGPRGPKGPKGPKGDTGPAGPQGAAGPAGAKGDTGAAGANGKDGAAGAAGATGAKGATGPTGPEGEAGEEGSPWTLGGTLPSEATETGIWTYGPSPAAETALFVPISFPVPLTQAAAQTMTTNGTANMHVVPIGGPAPSGCTGGTAEDPKADPGHLCIYVGATSAGDVVLEMLKASPAAPAVGIDPVGGRLLVGAATAGAIGNGTWAVTAP